MHQSILNSIFPIPREGRELTHFSWGFNTFLIALIHGVQRNYFKSYEKAGNFTRDFNTRRRVCKEP